MASSKSKQREQMVYMMDEEEAGRLMSRTSNMQVFQKIQTAKTNFGDKKSQLTHDCYTQLVGTVPFFSRQPYSETFDSDIVEEYLENAVLYQNATQLMEKREEFAVIEDDFGPTLEQMLKNGKTPSFKNLMDACRKFDSENYIQLHLRKSDETHTFFTEKGVEKNEAQAYAFAIAFYTGAYSWMVNMETNIFARRLQRDEANSEAAKVDDNAAMIMYYLIKGLSHINFYWGVVERYVKLTDEELKDYKPGELVTWLQFSSAEKSGKPLQWFKGRNTIFTIFSLTGRPIRYFSNCAEQEDEVLFLPHSSFLVCRVEEDTINKKHHIYMRQIELGLCRYVVMWVDDNIFNAEWENKGHMEKASTLGAHANVHFIPKSNTKAALAFLRSEFGQQLKRSHTFRIVTDMKRTNEPSAPAHAGARLIFEVRKLGFNQPCLIFTGNETRAYEKVTQIFGDRNPIGVQVTEQQSVLEKFALFK